MREKLAAIAQECFKLYGHQTPIFKTIQIRWAIHAEHCWRGKGDLLSDVHLWTFSHGRATVGRPTRTYLQYLCTDTGCSMGDLPRAIDDRDVWWERVREICASGTSWWWGYGIKYSNLIRIIWLGMSEPGCNSNEVVLYSLWNSGTGALSSDVVWCHT